MGLFNGLLGNDGVDSQNPQGPVQNPSNIVTDPPIKEEMVKNPSAVNSSPDHLNMPSDLTPLGSTPPSGVTRPNSDFPSAPTPPPAPSQAYSNQSDSFPTHQPIETPTPTPPPVQTSAKVSMEDLQDQLDVINNFKKNPTVEELVALMYHRDDYMAAVKNGQVDQLLENIRKYNPLVRAFNESNK